MDVLLARVALNEGEETYLDALSDLVGAYEDERHAIEPASVIGNSSIERSEIDRDRRALSATSNTGFARRSLGPSMLQIIHCGGTT